MTDVVVFPEGGYRYINAVFQYSGGVAAEPGFAIERARLAQPLPLREGFAAAESYLKSIGRPVTSFCSCELRSGAPLADADFEAFNRQYVATLERWGIYRNGINPVGRTNVCPVYQPPRAPVLYAFCYTVPAKPSARGTFAIAGGGECPEGKGNYRDHIVRLGDTSPDGLREKMRTVVREMERRLRMLGFSWSDAITTQCYTVHDVGSLVRDEIVMRGATPGGLTWHFCRPPIADLEYEMDVRGPARDIVI
jgi:hypothetical protein